MQYIQIGDDRVPAIGQGTWKMGAEGQDHRAEAAAVRYGIDVGLTLIDTAEAYAQGGSERVVAQAIKGIRDRVFLVTKVAPSNAGRDTFRHSLTESLKRLETDYVDLYLLHWPSKTVPLEETLAAMTLAHRDGLIRYIGLSNFPTEHLDEAQTLLGDLPIAADQVEYQLTNRRAETALIPYAARHGKAIMAYSPVKDLFDLGENHPGIKTLNNTAESHRVSAETVALAYLIGSGPVVAIPKAVQRAHIDANRQALDLELSADERRAIQEAFPSPGEDLPFVAL